MARYIRRARYINADVAEHLLMAGCELDEVPTEDVVPVIHAHWGVQRVTKSVKQGRTIPLILLSCSNCGQSNGRRISNYCPRCGAKMDE